jgi:hypothetical protein
MARRIRLAAGDDSVPDHDSLVRMIRRWERGGAGLSERYELLYREALDSARPPAQPANTGPAPWELAAALTRSSLSAAAAGLMEEAVTDLAARYPYTPPADLAPDVQSMLATVNTALGETQTLQVRARCVRLAGVLAGVAGQLADDSGRPDRSAAWFSAAGIAAAETGDPDLSAWALALRAIGCHFRGEYALSADLLSQASAAASSSAPRRQAWLAALSARAEAAVAAQRQQPGAGMPAVLQAVGDARAYLGLAGAPSGTDFFDTPRLAGMAGTSLLMLRDTGRARELLTEALDGRAPSDVKGRALLTLDLAECLAAEAEPEAAAALAGQALDMADGGASIVRPVAARAAAVHQALAPWASTGAVQDIKGRLAEIRAAGTEDG